MKICFLLQRQFAHVGHNLAILLKERYGIDEFCGYVYLRSSYDFLKKQEDILYSSLLLDEEIHHQYKQEKLDPAYLQHLEQEYGMPNLWHYIMVDRVVRYNLLVREYPSDTPIYTYEEMLRILQVKAKAIIDFLEKEKPDYIIFSAIGGIGSLLLHEIAKKKGIKILHLMYMCTKNKLLTIDTYKQTEGAKNLFETYKNTELGEQEMQEAWQFLEQFRNNPKTYEAEASTKVITVDRREHFKFLLPQNLIRSAKYFIKVIHESITKKDRHDYTYIPAWNYFKDHIKRKMRNLVGVNDLYDAFAPNVPYAFYPMHLEPEITLLLQAQFCTDQIHVIQQIARSLPVGWLLYVKDHPRMVMYRPRSHYKQLKKIPNVRLINPHYSGFEIIKHSQLVTTITGTAGWEALLMQKPVITFGDVFYNHLSFVKRCDSYEKLPYIVKEQFEDYKYDEKELIRFIAILFKESVDVNLAYLWEKEHDQAKKKIGLEPLAELIAKKINVI